MILADVTITELVDSGDLHIDPFLAENLQPGSVDLRLSNKLRIFKPLQQAYIDVQSSDFEKLTEILEIQDNGFIIHPGEFILGSTVEYFEIPDNLVARLEGRSSLGRLGIVVHSTAGYIDPGFKGNITLEISNLANIPIKLYLDMRIAQVSFIQMTNSAANPYGSEKLGSKYQFQSGPVASRIHLDRK